MKYIPILLIFLSLSFVTADEFGLGNKDSSGFGIGSETSSILIENITEINGTYNNYYSTSFSFVNSSSLWNITNNILYPLYGNITRLFRPNDNLDMNGYQFNSQRSSNGITTVGHDYKYYKKLKQGWNSFSIITENVSNDFSDRNISVYAGTNVIGYSSEISYPRNRVLYTYSGGSCYYAECKALGILNITELISSQTSITGVDFTRFNPSNVYIVQSVYEGNLTFFKVGGDLTTDTYAWSDLMFMNSTSGEVKNISEAFNNGNGWVGKPNQNDLDWVIQYWYWDTDNEPPSFVRRPISFHPTGDIPSWAGYEVWAKSEDIVLLRQDYNYSQSYIKVKEIYTDVIFSNYINVTSGNVCLSNGTGCLPISQMNFTNLALSNQSNTFTGKQTILNGADINQSLKVDNGLKIANSTSAQATYPYNIYSRTDPRSGAGSAIVISPSYDNARLYFGEKSTIFGTNKRFYDIDFSGTTGFYSLPSTFRMTADANTFCKTGASCSAIGIDASNDLVLFYGATQFITSPGNTGMSAGLHFKSHINDSFTYVSNRNSAYTFDTEYNKTQYTKGNHTDWAVNGINAMALDMQGNLIVTNNITTNNLIKLTIITLPTCSSTVVGSIGRNTTSTYGCNSTDWVRLF